MNLFYLIITIFLISIVIFAAKRYIYPRVKKILAKRKKLHKYQSEKEKMINLKQEVLFHLSWAKERGDSTDPFQQELTKINYDLEILDRDNPEIELSDMQSL